MFKCLSISLIILIKFVSVINTRDKDIISGNTVYDKQKQIKQFIHESLRMKLFWLRWWK